MRASFCLVLFLRTVCCPAFRMPMTRALRMPMAGDEIAPPGLPGGAIWLARCRRLSARCRGLVDDLADGGAGGGLVDEVLAGGEGCDEGLQGEVVDGAGVAAAGGVDQVHGVLGEELVGAAGEVHVVG